MAHRISEMKSTSCTEQEQANPLEGKYHQSEYKTRSFEKTAAATEIYNHKMPEVSISGTDKMVWKKALLFILGITNGRLSHTPN
jgi:hypothetical protein